MKSAIIAIALLASVSGCDNRKDMETRSYELSRLNNDEAMSLLTPYVGDGGYLSGKGKHISVRERPERLRIIEQVLQKYDGVGDLGDVILEMQVIDADGFTTRDTAIADVEQTLREMFKYRGYKLRGSVRIQARENSQFGQHVEDFQIRGRVFAARRVGNELRLPLEVGLQTRDTELMSTVTATVGKPVVLGQSTKGGAIILVVRTSLSGA